jgi:hypothetical protein
VLCPADPAPGPFHRSRVYTRVSFLLPHGPQNHTKTCTLHGLSRMCTTAVQVSSPTCSLFLAAFDLAFQVIYILASAWCYNKSNDKDFEPVIFCAVGSFQRLLRLSKCYATAQSGLESNNKDLKPATCPGCAQQLHNRAYSCAAHLQPFPRGPGLDQIHFGSGN